MTLERKHDLLVREKRRANTVLKDLVAAVLGPFTYGAVTWMINNNHRLAMLITGVFFLLALIVLMRVNKRHGRAAVA